MGVALPNVTKLDDGQTRENAVNVRFRIDDLPCDVRAPLHVIHERTSGFPGLITARLLAGGLKSYLSLGKTAPALLRLDSGSEIQNLTPWEWDRLARSLPVAWASPSRVRMAVLEVLYERLEHGFPVTDSAYIHARLDTLDDTAMNTTMYYLARSKYMENRAAGVYSLSAEGIDAIERSKRIVPGTGVGFAIMAFREDTNRLWDIALAPALLALGLTPIRIDAQPVTQPVIDSIHEFIRRSDLVVADLTFARPNCYYEVGVAHTLEKRMLLTARESEAVHFDLQAYPLLRWEDTTLELLRTVAAAPI